MWFKQDAVFVHTAMYTTDYFIMLTKWCSNQLWSCEFWCHYEFFAEY